MTDTTTTVDELVRRARELRPAERALLIERVVAELHDDASGTQQSRSLAGLWAEYAAAPSADEIDEARRETWSGFPHDTII